MNKEAFFQKFVTFTTSVHEVTHELTKDIKPEDITPVQYSILEYIAVSQPVTLSQISDCKHISMPNTSRELKKLTEKNLCEKFEVADDRRKQLIRLSELGQAMMNEAFQRIGERFLERIKDASVEDLKDINRALDVLQSKVFYGDK
ncbi:MarR family winged helix-turn-helix transcriptional regulator [Paenibacillus apiarius]|uniref:MarR family transcriptional regulator n=1 Tax=Paenibacillus apiarius TaxID=46240 RepID=A0ABT4DWC3_9BACL|nr:MarR family transcriptional regulator [Paenibacillus apiarius]MBN3526565.1 MarR family transcriptional regulator [Paenibacillus apiarius]MCY9517695.1 MarR family transcriptional regulator [Paenibacillus apiarius]MCY9521652.1 MarR family transcriptional regulator [Paenibacillus apiarius]MCY9555330.1 MarR family transcriptional regulator [Paenibacillus apiarius]MCY9561210.1 MarR family transcriptional regulator [Paenibacillus apiarius]